MTNIRPPGGFNVEGHIPSRPIIVMAESVKQAPEPFPESENVLYARELSPQGLWLWPQLHFRGNLLKVFIKTGHHAPG